MIFCFTLYRIQNSNEYKLEIVAFSNLAQVVIIINFLVKNKIFLHLKIRTDCIGSNNEKLLQEQIVRYTPSEEHRKNCKDDLCHINARLEFIETDSEGYVFNSKSSEDDEEEEEEEKVIDTKGSVTNSKLFKDRRTVTNFRQKKCTN